ncbi:hypothetical protein P9D43_20960 [Neobacillus niacini]|uniref:hypothetical protein n=1 Tax=Neobacillus niacini TaxID=86668 RepID=UPI0007AB9283|nr:hypothetical protein [Neobacillus niacini]MEC1524477.1 hypothetical protein [Neobacillus niacini]
MKEHALYYHYELLELKKLITDIEEAIEWAEAAESHLTSENDPDSIFGISISYSKVSLVRSLEKFKYQHDKIVQSMSNLYI